MSRFALYAPLYQGQRSTPAWLTVPLAIVTLYAVPWIANHVLVFVGLRASAADGVWQDNILALFVTGLVLAALWFWLTRREHRGLGDIGLMRPWSRSFWPGFVFGTVLVAVVVGAGLYTGFYDLNSPGAWYDHLTPTWLVAVPLAIIGSIIQVITLEALFRGWMMQAMAARWSGFAAVFVSSLVFVLSQAGDPRPSPEAALCALNLFLFSWYFALSAIRDDDLWGVIGTHAALVLVTGLGLGLNLDGNHLNVTPMIVNLSPHDGAPDWLSGGAFGPDGSALMTVLALGCVSWRLLRDRRPKPRVHYADEYD